MQPHAETQAAPPPLRQHVSLHSWSQALTMRSSVLHAPVQPHAETQAAPPPLRQHVSLHCWSHACTQRDSRLENNSIRNAGPHTSARLFYVTSGENDTAAPSRNERIICLSDTRPDTRHRLYCSGITD